MMRIDGRSPDQLRPISIEIGAAPYAEGSALIAYGKTRVLCTATVEDGVPAWMRGQQSGWVTAEYAMLPRATLQRTRRERNGPSGRTQEIQRLIGRSLRAAIDLNALGERTITIDCDVLQADGGTRTAAISGGYVALALAVDYLVRSGVLETRPTLTPVAAVSVGMLQGVLLLDLCYEEDSQADLDCNVVMNSAGGYIEVQATAERSAVTRDQLNALLDLAGRGIQQILDAQAAALATALPNNAMSQVQSP
ncbi:MAG TPA: ribonuclease PH [Chloroflexus aurantiacus]|jgi:ribonuclease PH|uniref:Ribonuclease PH n=1 Tax=Chloroflexus aurantiacus (strain ATCC 29366 / DSM 635 / J-10-fl) TaxID=324602 RepID=A9WCA5_CHLAA|nr:MULTISPECIES: ribonuclease PH [Chloroflexus]ABY33498.1 ribonuclease PH [Chloroflexus aurantiacus J-10-fl]RMG51885.1 MAG: ribonuclease PH [Chloroflexota bacterium]HBW65632.1 ribonuclease PH [Chloroflexus aurantiacus]